MRKLDLTLTNARNFNPGGNVSSRGNVANIKILNMLLANEFTLFTKTLNFHWNVTGPNFTSLHSFLEDSYKSLLEILDAVAERVRVLGDKPMSTIDEIVHHKTIVEDKTETPNAQDMLNELLRDHLLIQYQIKEALNGQPTLATDFGTQDFLIELLRKHEVMCWKLQSHFT